MRFVRIQCALALRCKYLAAHGVLSPLKLHLQVVERHSGLLVRGARAGWNLLFLLASSVALARLALVHLPGLCWGLVVLGAGCEVDSLSDSSRPGQGRGPGAGDGRGSRRFGLRQVPRLLPALLQSTQVGRAEGGRSTVRDLR